MMLTILFKLLRGEKITAKELAQEFEISEKSVYRYIEKLCFAGVPIVSLKGKNGGFQIYNFHYDNLFFTKNEVEVLIKEVEKLDDNINNKLLLSKLELLK